MKIFNSITVILLLSLSFTFINTEIEQEELFIPCATPCISSNNCYTSTCDTAQGVCVETVKSVLPEECCFSSSDCKTGDCVFSSCNLDVNQCEYIEICPGSNINITKKACVNDNQCQGDNPCSYSKCIDNVCQNSPLTNPSNVLCCSTQSDCLPSPCSETFCNIDTFTCFYIPILGCEISFGASVISSYYSTSTSSSSSSALSSEAMKYVIPNNPDAGDIFFTILGSIILFLVVVIFVTAVIYTIYDYFWGDRNDHHDALGEAAAAGHTEHGGH